LIELQRTLNDHYHPDQLMRLAQPGKDQLAGLGIT
jgi:hypothetical protein